MAVDVEARLREALHARAAEIEPDPRTWERVQARLRRARLRRWTAVGALAAAVAAAAVVLPGALGPRIAFDAPVADQPDAGQPDADRPGVDRPGVDAPAPAVEDPEAVDLDPPGSLGAPEPDPGPPPTACYEPAGIFAVYSGGGDLAVACAGGAGRALTSGPAADTNPAVSLAGDAVVFERVDGGEAPVLVHRGLGEGDGEQVLGGGSLPAFAPDGRLAWVQESAGRAYILVGHPFGEPEAEIGVEQTTGPTRVSALAWDPADDWLLYTTVDGAGVSQTWTVRPDGSRRELLEPVEDSYAAVATAPDGTLAALSWRTSDGPDLDLVTIDRGMLEGAGPDGVAVHTPLGAQLDARADRLTLATAGYARLPRFGEAGGWHAATYPSWFVADGRTLVLVEFDGTTTPVAAGVDAVSVNPAVELPSDSEESDPAVAELDGDPLPEQPGLPDGVAVTRERIAQAAAAGDVGGLHALMADGFTYSYGGDDDPDEAAAYLRANPEVVRRVPALLATPYGVVAGATAPLYVWPRAHALEVSGWTDEDRAALRSLGATDADIARWSAGEGYTGLRLGIGEDGAWQFLVEGD